MEAFVLTDIGRQRSPTDAIVLVATIILRKKGPLVRMSS